MIELVSDKDIAFATADLIVNAANGCGVMPGGISAALNARTNGKLEREAKRELSKNSSHIIKFPLAPGKYFITDGCGLDCTEVFHAVTMRFPGLRCNFKCIEPLVNQMFEYCRSKGYKSIAVPLLGCGTGGLDPEKVFDIISEYAEKYPDIAVDVYGKMKK